MRGMKERYSYACGRAGAPTGAGHPRRGRVRPWHPPKKRETWSQLPSHCQVRLSLYLYFCLASLATHLKKYHISVTLTVVNHLHPNLPTVCSISWKAAQHMDSGGAALFSITVVLLCLGDTPVLPAGLETRLLDQGDRVVEGQVVLSLKMPATRKYPKQSGGFCC